MRGEKYVRNSFCLLYAFLHVRANIRRAKIPSVYCAYMCMYVCMYVIYKCLFVYLPTCIPTYVFLMKYGDRSEGLCDQTIFSRLNFLSSLLLSMYRGQYVQAVLQKLVIVEILCYYNDNNNIIDNNSYNSENNSNISNSSQNNYYYNNFKCVNEKFRFSQIFESSVFLISSNISQSTFTLF